MWRIETVIGGQAEGIAYREADLDTSRSRGSQPVQFLADALGAKGGAWIKKLEEAIPTWLESGDLEASGTLLQEIEVDPSYWTKACKAVWPEPPFEGDHPGAVWLDQSFVLMRKPDGVLSIELEYTASDADHRRTTILENALGGPSTAAVEWFATFGDQTLVASAEVQFQGLGRVKRARIYLAEKAGWIFGRVVRYRINALSRRQTDPLFKHRLQSLEARKSKLAKEVPNIFNYPSPNYASSKGPELVVLVHGTFSCAMRMLTAMDEQDLTPTNNNMMWVRYEHDTFLPVNDNAIELARLVRTKLPDPNQPKVIFVCHSRGGIVAVEAVKRLIQPDDSVLPALPALPASSFEVATFGTPHAGTPIAAAAEGVSSILRGMLRAASRMAFTSLGLDPVGWAFGWAIGRANFPRGVAAMNPDSDLILSYSKATHPFYVAGVGGFIDLSSNEDGFFPIAKASVLDEIMDGKPHDGVVPLDSSLTNCEPLCSPAEQCGHSDYFSRQDTLAPLLGDDSLPAIGFNTARIVREHFLQVL